MDIQRTIRIIRSDASTYGMQSNKLGVIGFSAGGSLSARAATLYEKKSFLFATADDTWGNSALVMAGALRDAKVPVELHFMTKGGHGYGLRPGNIADETWPHLAETWLKNVVQENHK